MQSVKIAIHSIYLATEGEGIHIGRPQIFVRFQGCDIGCRNCDSKETWAFKGPERSLESVLSEIHNLGLKGKIKHLSITGGDPLHEAHLPGLQVLMKNLKGLGYFINIEAAGTKVVEEVFQLADFISFDFKTPSTGVTTHPELILKMQQDFPGKFQVKAVIETQHDFAATYEAYLQLKERLGDIPFSWCLTPSYNPREDFPMERFIMVIELNQKLGGPFRVIGQQHKWIFGSNAKNK